MVIHLYINMFLQNFYKFLHWLLQQNFEVYDSDFHNLAEKQASWSEP